MLITRRTLSLVLFALLLSATAVRAANLPAPEGPVLLRITGAIDNTTDGNAALFDHAQLTQLGMRTVHTRNPFLEGEQTFEGVLLADVLDRVGARGAMLRCSALDGYSVELTIDEIRRYEVLLAMKRNGQAMTVRTNGPLWVIYPISKFPEIDSQEFSLRSIWQLVEITVLD